MRCVSPALIRVVFFHALGWLPFDPVALLDCWRHLAAGDRR
jgi:hypothetical protein